ncbi:MAG TPA: hypothetical protein VII99_07835 [Bacteroidia bacterium]
MLKVKIFVFIFFTSYSLFSFTQNNFKIILGSGFKENRITLLEVYGDKKSSKVDTLMLDEILTTNPVTGLAQELNAPVKNNASIIVYVEGNNLGSFSSDNWNKKSQLKIDLGNLYNPSSHEKRFYLDFSLKEKSKFSFY